jgi:hypothetical protein
MMLGNVQARVANPGPVDAFLQIAEPHSQQLHVARYVPR